MRHGVISARMPRMAAADAAHGEPAATQHAVAPNRLQRVLRAGRMKAACGAEQRAHRPLVQPDQDLGKETHCSVTLSQRVSRLAMSSALRAPRARARALTTMSRAGSCPW